MSRSASIFLVSLCTGCSFYMPNPPCPPPPSAKFPTTDTYSCDSETVPLCVPNPKDELALCELVDVALQNSPKTRKSWYNAKEAATQLGTARGAYIPKVDFQAYWEKTQYSGVFLEIESINFQKSISMGFSTSYLMFDFGGRNAKLASALAALSEANWQYDWDVQTVMITTIQNYYNYVNALGIFHAREESVKYRTQTYEAARALTAGGVHSISDELQAETSLLDAQIALENARKSVNISYATLVQSLGLPPDSCIFAADLPEKIETKGVCGDMAVLLRAAKEHRADLKAARAFILEQKANIRSARSDFLPSMTNDTAGSKVSLTNLKFLDNYTLKFTLDVPLFSAFADINAIRQAQAELLAAQASLDDEELQAYLEVLTSYYDFIANTQVLKYSCNYLETARKNQKVAFANYKLGVTTIIDLMVANEAITTAEVQMVNSKTEFLTSLGNLAYHTGGLTVADVKGDQTVKPELVETGENLEIDTCFTD